MAKSIQAFGWLFISEVKVVPEARFYESYAFIYENRLGENLKKN
jgi:hypothetical protein